KFDRPREVDCIFRQAEYPSAGWDTSQDRTKSLLRMFAAALSIHGAMAIMTIVGFRRTSDGPRIDRVQGASNESEVMARRIHVARSDGGGRHPRHTCRPGSAENSQPPGRGARDRCEAGHRER